MIERWGTIRSQEESSEASINVLVRILNQLDPYGLRPGRQDGVPKDEYQPVAEAFWEAINVHGAVSGHQVDAIWRNYFGEILSGRCAAITFAAFVREINEVPCVAAPVHHSPAWE